MRLDNITPIILTYNEAPNIGRALEKLRWAREVIVLDSFSIDETEMIAKKFNNVRFVQRKFDWFAPQRNFGIGLAQTEWVLSMDADFILSDELISELVSIQENSEVNGYFSKFHYCVFGKKLRSSILPPLQVLFRKNNCEYMEKQPHVEKASHSGKSSFLKSFIIHDDRKSLGRWFATQEGYARIGADKLYSADLSQLNWKNKIRRRVIFAPFLVLVYTLFFKGLILDGYRGFYYSFQRMFAELMLSICLLEKMMRPD